MLWMKDLEDKYLGTTHEIKSGTCTVLPWVCNILKVFKYFVFHNIVFSYSVSMFHYAFLMCLFHFIYLNLFLIGG